MYCYNCSFCSVESAYNNQRQLEAEAKQLQLNVSRLSKQTQQWISMIDNFNHTLKELGDVENWARAIETDMLAIASALEYAYKGDPSRLPHYFVPGGGGAT